MSRRRYVQRGPTDHTDRSDHTDVQVKPNRLAANSQHERREITPIVQQNAAKSHRLHSKNGAIGAIVVIVACIAVIDVIDVIAVRSWRVCDPRITRDWGARLFKPLGPLTRSCLPAAERC